jgi:hypothetical protein
MSHLMSLFGGKADMSLCAAQSGHIQKAELVFRRANSATMLPFLV